MATWKEDLTTAFVILKEAAHAAMKEADERLAAAQADAAKVDALGPSNPLHGESSGPNPAKGQPHYTEGIAPDWAKAVPMDDPRRPPQYRPNTGALAFQVGGSHYKNLTIQPVEYATYNSLGWIEGNIIKHITRHDRKGGKGEQDVQKAAHYCRLLLQLVYGVDQEGLMPMDVHQTLVDAAVKKALGGPKGSIPDPLAGKKIENDSPEKQNRRELARHIALNWYGHGLERLLQEFANAFNVQIVILPASEDDPFCEHCGRSKSCHTEEEDFEPVNPERNRLISQVHDLALRWKGTNPKTFLKLMAQAIHPAEADEMLDSDLEDDDDDPEENELLAARMEHARQIDDGEIVVIKYLDDEFNLDTVGKIDAIKSCARCGQDHDHIPYLPLRNGPGGLTHWAICPTTGEPILIWIQVGTAKTDSEAVDGYVQVELTPSKMTQH